MNIRAFFGLKDIILHQPVFPQEIFNLIIDEFSNDKKTLARSSLVCRAWAHSCRHHLFSQISITCFSPKSQKIFHRLLYDYAVAVRLGPTFFPFGEPMYPYLWVTSLVSTLQEYVHNLLHHNRQPTHHSDEVISSTFPQTNILVFIFNGQACPGFDTVQYDFIRRLSTVFPCITILEFQDSFETFHDTAQLICSFPELEVLTLRFIVCHDLWGDVSHFQLPTGLHTLDLSGRFSSSHKEISHFINWFNYMKCPPELLSFRVSFLYPPVAGLNTSLPQLIAKHSSTLQCLKVPFIPCELMI